MKVLLITLHYFPVIGGIEQWAQNIAERLSEKAGIFVITGKVKGQKTKEIRNGVSITRTSLFNLENLSYSSPLYIISALPFILFRSFSLIRREKIDLLHCQGFLSSFLGYLIYKMTKIPYISTVQRLEEDKGFFRRLAYCNAKVCIAASQAIKKYFEEIGVKNIEVIPNGIDLGKFSNLNREKSRKNLGLNSEFAIMTVARLEKVKGIDYLIKAVNPSDNFKLIAIGGGSERKNLESLAKERGIKEKIVFLGEIPNEKIGEYLVAADCFVLPSLKEGFGIVILEAMACRVPVIGTDVGGIKDIIENNKNGILVSSKDSSVLAAALERIRSNPGLALQLADNALSALNRYNWSNISERVFDIYLKTAI
ncbi:MAG: glycosyltransferase family 4 protein [Candidatus Parcubacteria bacterium]|nr:glycosyltransferase family 4 protein [Candidatus Parcubacteria bacterium]